MVTGPYRRMQTHTTTCHHWQMFWGSIFIDQGPLNETRPSSSLDAEPPQPLKGTSSWFDRAAIEGLGPVPFVQPLCKHLHSPLSHLDLPSAFICALVHRRERARGCRRCFPKSASVVENCGNCQLLVQSRTFLRRCRGKSGRLQATQKRKEGDE